jgi:hypothetical protein
MAQTRPSRILEGRATRGIARAGAAKRRRQGGADDPFAVVMSATHHSVAERSNANCDNCPVTAPEGTMRQEWGKVNPKYFELRSCAGLSPQYRRVFEN